MLAAHGSPLNPSRSKPKFFSGSPEHTYQGERSPAAAELEHPGPGGERREPGLLLVDCDGEGLGVGERILDRPSVADGPFTGRVLQPRPEVGDKELRVVAV